MTKMSPNKNYIRGRNNEYKAIRLLQKAGYDCIRSAGSHGTWDIIAYNSNGIRFIQVKTNDCVTALDLESIQEFNNIPPNSTKELWTFYNRKSSPKIERF